MGTGADAAAPPRPADEIVVPKLSSPAQMGKIAFDENCAACHGPKASGTENGPPLIHRIYEPSHHADFAFVRAARQGVKAHHWRFGDMAPVEGVTDKQIEWITRYVREVQRANGIM
jgi:mono/diheme cytochrome c family protein